VLVREDRPQLRRRSRPEGGDQGSHRTTVTPTTTTTTTDRGVAGLTRSWFAAPDLAAVEWRGYDPAMRLVLLHALPLDGRMWDATGTRFGGAFAPTLYGLGESVRDWAVAVLEHCGIDELLVVGNSVGGSCALEVARAAPGQVRGVVLVGAKPGCRPDDWCAGVLRPARSRRVSRVLEWCGSCRRETPKRTPTCRRCFVASRPR
jgi:pimeloyl-ACP methyl ester carboxylesterase